MSSIRRTLARIGALFRTHDRADVDLRAEMEAHLAMAIDENIRRGMSPAEARRRALIAAGGLTQAAEEVRAQRGLPWLESFVADTRYAIRHFRRTPLSTITMVLVLSLGIGTNVVLFTVLNSLATMPAPGMERDASLVRIRAKMRMKGVLGEQARVMSWPEVQEYASRTELFSGVAAFADEVAVLNLGDAQSSNQTVRALYTTPNYFSVLNMHPALGSVPMAEADPRLGTAPTAMISHAVWQQRFGGAADVIGRIVRVNDVPVEIVGVAPPRFLGTEGSRGPTIWLPLSSFPLIEKRSPAVFASYDSMFLAAAARLRPGVTTETASPVVDGIAQRAFRPGQDAAATRLAGGDITVAKGENGGADVVPMLVNNHQIRRRSDLLIAVGGSSGFALLVLLITCTNVSALLVGQAVARRREIGVRLSLGAPRKRLIRQLLTESVLLALVAGAIGLLVTTMAIRLLANALEDLPLVVDWRVTGATCAVAIITGILFGLSPALHAMRISVSEVLKNSALSVAATRSRLQQALVVAQITLTQPLLVGLGVLIVMIVTDLGSETTSRVADQIVEIEIDTWAGNVTPQQSAARLAALVERVAAVPGVTAAMPLQMGTITAPLAVHPVDRVPGITYETAMQTSMVAAPMNYFSAFAIPIIRGRDFDSSERANPSADPLRSMTYNAVIIGSDLARRFWGDADPIGKRLVMMVSSAPNRLPLTVVGIVDETAAGPSTVNGEIRVYVPFSVMNAGVIVRTAGAAQPMLNELRKVVTAEVPQMPISRAQTMEQREADERSEIQRASGAAAGGGLLALLLSAIGLYAVVSFAVGQRTREIGIRTALGAQHGQVVRMFFANGLLLSVLGLALGLPLSMIVTRFIAGRLNWPLASYPLLGVAIGAVVLIIASIAVWIPARRASTIPPIVALRAE